MQTAQTIEVLPPIPPASQIVVQATEQLGLDPVTSQSLQDAFGGYFAKADEWRNKALAIKVQDTTDFAAMKDARAARLELRQIRIDAEKTRKALKEDSLRKGKAIDGIYALIEMAIKPLEEHLDAQEKFIERARAEQARKLRAEREAALAPFGPVSQFLKLEEMSEAEFQDHLETVKLAHEARIERERREAEAKAEQERRQREEQERLRAENERLQREKAEAEAKARAEREKAEAERREAEAKARADREALEAKARAEREAAERQAAAERAAREKAEAELRAQREAEERQRQEQEAAARALAMAPDRDKLAAFAAAVRALHIPELDSELGKAIEATLRDQVAKFAAWADAQARKLNA